MAPHPLDDAIEALRAAIEEGWDADDSMSRAHVAASPPGRFAFAAHVLDPEALRWLVHFAARRALACWESSCDDARPRRIVEALGQHLRSGGDVDWEDATEATASPFDDCRYSDTQSAADAVAQAAQYLHRRDPVHAVHCISAADTAHDHVLVEHRFRQWLLDVAIPAALQKREMTSSEQEALRG